MGGGFAQLANSIMKANKRPRRKMYGSYKSYDNSKDKERAERRIYKYAEASEEHLRRIRKRLNRQHRVLRQKNVAALTFFVIIGAIAFYIMLS